MTIVRRTNHVWDPFLLKCQRWTSGCNCSCVMPRWGPKRTAVRPPPHIGDTTPPHIQATMPTVQDPWGLMPTIAEQIETCRIADLAFLANFDKEDQEESAHSGLDAQVPRFPAHSGLDAQVPRLPTIPEEGAPIMILSTEPPNSTKSVYCRTCDIWVSGPTNDLWEIHLLDQHHIEMMALRRASVRVAKRRQWRW